MGIEFPPLRFLRMISFQNWIDLLFKKRGRGGREREREIFNAFKNETKFRLGFEMKANGRELIDRAVFLSLSLSFLFLLCWKMEKEDDEYTRR